LAAIQIRDAEERILTEVVNGGRLDKARQMFGYHKLQRGN